MWWPFRKKKTEKELKEQLAEAEVGDVIRVNSMQELDQLLSSTKAQPRPPCPEVLIATNSCVCIACPKKDKCTVEAMSKSAGCIGCFVAYCSLKDSMKTQPLYEFGELPSKEWAEHMCKKYGIPTSSRPIVLSIERETDDGKKERKSRRADIHTGCDNSAA